MIFIIVFFIFILTGVLICEFIQIDRDFTNSIGDILKRILVVSFIILLVSNIDSETLISLFKKLIRNTFLLGLIFLTFSLVGGIEIVNENAVSILILPYSGYIVFIQRKLIKKIVTYGVLIVILYLTAGRTALLAFILTPFFLIFIKSTTLKVFYFTFVSLGLTILQIVFIEKLSILDKVLSGRIYIQEAYVDSITEKLSIILVGSGEFILGESVHYGLGPHHTWLGLIWTFGITGMILNLLIIIYSMKFKLKTEYLYLHLILMYIFILQLFESINLGGISYPSLLLLMTILLKIKLHKEYFY